MTEWDGGIGSYLHQRTEGRYDWHPFACPARGMALEYGYNFFGSGGPSQKQSLGFIEEHPGQRQDGHPYPESRVKVPSNMIASGDFVFLEARYSDGQEVFADPFFYPPWSWSYPPMVSLHNLAILVAVPTSQRREHALLRWSRGICLPPKT